jgi:transglutaminase-like putative cysteine protease
MKKLGSFLFALLFLTSLSVSGRWADPSEAASAVNFERNDYQVRKNGSYKVLVERQIEILKDKARVDLGLMRLNYDAHNSSLKVLEAKTINGERSVPVLKKHIETKPLASSGPGFDVTNQVTIAFPDVSVGSKLYVKYEREVKSPFVPNTFWVHETYGWKEWIQDLRVTLQSEVPLFAQSHDPEKILTIEKSVDGKRIAMRMKKPIFKMVVEEDNVSPDPNVLPWFAVSTMKDWTQVPPSTVQAYEQAIHSALPARFLPILERARTVANETDQINTVTSMLADQVRYVGDWVPTKGAFHPRKLETIAQTGFGDCKDFSVSTAAILEKLGYEVHGAWISRGRELVFSPLELPTLDFNHAIVYAKKGDREFWIDPTNFTSFAQGIFPDIADRRVLVLDPKKPELKRTPPLQATQSGLEVSTALKFRPDSLIDGSGEVKLQGTAMLSVTGWQMTYSKQQMDYMLISWLTNVGKILSWKFDDYSLNSRVVSDFKTPYSYQEQWRPIQTSAGTGYLIPAPPDSNYFQFKRDQRVSGIQLPDPIRWRRSFTFSGKSSLLKSPIECSDKSEWIDFSRRIQKTAAGVEFSEEIVLKKSVIPASAIQTKEFGRLHDSLTSCLQQAVIVFE